MGQRGLKGSRTHILNWGGGGILHVTHWGGPTLFLSVDFVNILPKKGGGQTLMSTKALTKF